MSTSAHHHQTLIVLLNDNLIATSVDFNLNSKIERHNHLIPFGCTIVSDLLPCVNNHGRMKAMSKMIVLAYCPC